MDDNTAGVLVFAIIAMGICFIIWVANKYQD